MPFVGAPVLTGYGDGLPNDPPTFPASSYFRTEVYLSWTESTGDTGYDVYRQLPGDVYVLLTSVSGLTYTDSAHTETDGPYCRYKVQATNGGAFSDFSNVKYITYNFEPEPSPSPPSSKILLNSGNGILLNATGTILLN